MDVLAIDPGIHNMAVAVVRGPDIQDWRIVDLVPGVKKPPIARIVAGAATFVQGIDLAHVAEVRLEQQPNQNVAMKTLCHALQGMFLIRGVAHVHIVNPKTYKLRGGSYAQRKRDSVTRVQQAVAADPRWGPVFSGHAKKDDLADALLLASFTPPGSTE